MNEAFFRTVQQKETLREGLETLASSKIPSSPASPFSLLSHSEGSPRASTSSPVFFPFQSTYRQPLWVGKTGFHPGSSWLCNPAPVTISLCLSFVTCKMRTVNIPESEVLMHRGWSIANY